MTVRELIGALERFENKELEVVVEDPDDSQAWLGVTSISFPEGARVMLRTGE
jgi:hypothetical protein